MKLKLIIIKPPSNIPQFRTLLVENQRICYKAKEKIFSYSNLIKIMHQNIYFRRSNEFSFEKRYVEYTRIIAKEKILF